MLSRRFVVIYILISLSAHCFSQVVKTPFPINKLSWSMDGKVFSFTEGNTIFFRNAETYEFIDSLNIEKVDQIEFSREGDRQVLLTMTKDGLFSAYDFEYSEDKLTGISKSPYFSKDYSNNQRITQAVFSTNSDFVAAARQDNSIDLFFKLRISKEAISRKLSGHNSEILSMMFSRDSKYLLSTSVDGTIIVWNCNSGKKELILKTNYMDAMIPAVYLNTDQIIVCSGETNFSIYDLKGNRLLSIDTLNKIRMIKPLLNGRYVSILTNKNEIEIYDLLENKWIGYIPSYSLFDVTDYQFNRNCKLILIGIQDGSIFKFLLRDVLLHPNDRPEKVITVVPNYKKTNSTIEGNNSVVVSGGANYMQAPFLISADLDAQIRFKKKDGPLFAGFGIGGQLGFSRSESYNKYNIGDEKFKRLNLISGMAYIPFGFQFPSSRNDLSYLLLFKGGGKFSEPALFKNSRYIIGDHQFTYFVSGGVGLIYKFFETTVNLEYDGIGGLNPSVYAGLNLKLG